MENILNHSWNSSQYSKTSDLQAAVADELIKNLRIKPDEDILDVGCGIGNITMNIASIASKGRVQGIDNSSSMIKQANKKLLSGSLSNISFKVMNVIDLNFNRQFDVVFSNSVFHWIKNQEKILHAIHRSLKSEGRLGVQFPLLDESHPMISAVSAAISHLDLKHHYVNWEFPWFVPESANKYSELLNRCRYKNIMVKEAETYYTFNSTLTMINFFKSVGLKLMMEPLCLKDRISLEKEINNLVEQHTKGNQIKLPFRRLYIYAGT